MKKTITEIISIAMNGERRPRKPLCSKTVASVVIEGKMGNLSSQDKATTSQTDSKPVSSSASVEPKISKFSNNLRVHASLKIDFSGIVSESDIKFIVGHWVDIYDGEFNIEGLYYTIYLIAWSKLTYNPTLKIYTAFLDEVITVNTTESIVNNSGKIEYTLSEVLPYKGSTVDILFNISVMKSQQLSNDICDFYDPPLEPKSMIELLSKIHNPRVKWVLVDGQIVIVKK